MPARLLDKTQWIAPLLLIGGAIVLTGCQSTSSSEQTSAIPALESAAEPAAQTEEAASADQPDVEATQSAAVQQDGPVSDEAPPTEQPSVQSENDQLRSAAVRIAGVEKERGRQAAFQSVLACYERAKVREAPVSLAKVCATQDFVISRGRQAAGGQRDQQLIIAERAPQRIGALMELKGMGQAEFNSFGLFLNRVALPAYQQARL